MIQNTQNIRSDIPAKNTTFFVVRDTATLKEFKDLLFSTNNNEDIIAELLNGNLDLSRALLPVRVTSLKEGSPKDNAMLCISSPQDMEDLCTAQNDEFSEYNGPTEPQHKGPKNLFPFIYKKYSKDLLSPNVQLTGRNTRWLMGYLQSADYSLLKGKGAGIGYVSALALCFHFKMVERADKRDLILFRNTNTLQYRFCKLDIIV